MSSNSVCMNKSDCHFAVVISLITCIQLFRGRLSHKSVKVNATMSKVIMGNGVFTRQILVKAQGIIFLR